MTFLLDLHVWRLPVLNFLILIKWYPLLNWSDKTCSSILDLKAYFLNHTLRNDKLLSYMLWPTMRYMYMCKMILNLLPHMDSLTINRLHQKLFSSLKWFHPHVFHVSCFCVISEIKLYVCLVNQSVDHAKTIILFTYQLMGTSSLLSNC